MIENKEKEKIIEWIKLGHSDYKIGKTTGHSHNTIKPIRKEFFENLKRPKSSDEVEIDSPIDFFRNEKNRITEGIKKFHLEGKEKKELEKLVNDIEKIIDRNVDERLPVEIAKAIEKNDQKWYKVIEQHYVKKEVVKEIEEHYENKLKEKNNIIENLINENKNKDDINKKQHSKYLQNLNYIQNENDTLKKQNYGLNNEFLNVMNNNIYLNNYINYRLEDVLRYGRNELNSKWLILNRQILDFEKFKNKLINFFNDHLLKMHDVNNDLIIREKRIVNVERSLNDLIEWTINKRN